MKTFKNYFILVFVAFISFTACNTAQNQKQAGLLKSGIHTVIVKDLLQTSQYTYFLLKEVGNPDKKDSDTLWAAVIKTESKAGDTLYYKGGFIMKEFKSKELNKTFKEVLFLDSLSKSPDFAKPEMGSMSPHQNVMSKDSAMTGKPKIVKIDVKIDPVAKGVTIADLYAKKASYSGKTIKVKGKVTKFSPEIMGKNWIHIQDGTQSNGKFDLTITTGLTVNVGDVVTFEGTIALDKDFGFSYFYEVIMENAKIVK